VAATSSRELAAGKLGRLDRHGRITEFPLRSRAPQPYALALGP
jgi:hypothetical protein